MKPTETGTSDRTLIKATFLALNSRSVRAMFEAGLFFVVALVFCLVQTFWSGSPYLTLLFDSSGYLWVAEGLQKCWNGAALAAIMHYLSSGCDESARVVACQQLQPAMDICKTGPVLPVMTAAWFSLIGKSVSPQNWPAAATLMCILTASISPVLYLWSRRMSGVVAGRLAGILAATYPAFLVNSGRLLSEIPATAICTFAFYLLWSVCDSVVSRLSRPSQKTGGYFREGLVAGLALALVMLARPPLLLLPLLLVPLLVWANSFRRKSEPSASAAPNAAPGRQQLLSKLSGSSILFAGVTCGALLLYVPWIGTKTILTGKPSLTVDRYGSYNLWAGCNIANDGWDVLPSRFVNHPDEFESSVGEVAGDIAGRAAQAPGDFVNLVLKKIPRLVAAPWNDFQSTALGASWSLQRFWHQLLLLAGLFGFVGLVRDGVERGNKKLLTGAAIVGCVLSYHLVNVLFITMSRYFVVCLPLIILLASRLLDEIFAARIKHPKMMTVSLFLFPFVCLAGGGVLSDATVTAEITRLIAPLSFSMVFSVAITSALAYGLVLSMRSQNLPKSMRLPMSFVLALLTMSCLVSTRQYAEDASTTVTSKSNNTLKLQANCNPCFPDSTSFLVVDFAPGADMRNTSAKVNGKTVAGTWAPLWSRMPSWRENITYLSAFAYSSGRQMDDIRQWHCMEIPSSVTAQQSSTTIELALPSGTEISADPTNLDGESQGLSLERFSWSKGFFADNPGEMRMPEPHRYNLSRLSEMEQLTHAQIPRAFLLVVKSKPLQNQLSPNSGVTFEVPPQTVGLAPSERLRYFEIRDSVLASFCNEMARVRVSGKVRTVKGSGSASVCLVEKVVSGQKQLEEFAPLAPQQIPAGPEWTAFEFDDFVPVSNERRLKSLKVLFAGRPWWEVLSYNSTKGKATLEFTELRVQVSSANGFELSEASITPLTLH